MPSKAKGPRQTIKSKHRPDWQEQVRQECLQRVHTQREQLLHQCRVQPVQQTLQSILNGVTQQSLLEREEAEPERIPPPANKMTITYDENPPRHTEDPSKPLLGHQLLSVKEHQELMAQMEAALFDDSYKEELEAIEAAEIQDISGMFARHCIVNHMPEVEECKVLCPICEETHLVESAYGSISCPVDQFCVEAPLQGVDASLKYVKNMLCTKLEEHKASGCREKPHFFVKCIASENLYMACFECGAFEIIL